MSVLDKKIKTFQSDRRGEYPSLRFFDTLMNLGIQHRVSPNTSEQNRMAERKHRNIRELGLTMMLHAKIPKRYRVDCFTIVVCLINRLPSSVLNMDSPCSRLFGIQPDYSMLRVSGCRRSLYLGDNTKDKIDPRSLPCVFMGYSNK